MSEGDMLSSRPEKRECADIRNDQRFLDISVKEVRGRIYPSSVESADGLEIDECFIECCLLKRVDGTGGEGEVS